MIVFTVHEPPNPPADRIDRAEKLEFVRDGFTPLAAAIPPLWMALNKLWIVLLLYLLASMGLSLVLAYIGVPAGLIASLNVAANIVIGFEADNLKRWTLSRRGWAELGSVVGRNRAECERRFFDGWLGQQPVLLAAGRNIGRAWDDKTSGSTDFIKTTLSQQSSKSIPTRGVADLNPGAGPGGGEGVGFNSATDGGDHLQPLNKRPAFRWLWHRVTGR